VTALLNVKRDTVPEFCYGSDGTVAFRLPNSPFLQELARGVGTPIISTSANLTGAPHCESVEEAWEIFGDAIDLYVDGGPQEALPSTMVDLTGSRPRLLRVGLHALRGLQLEGDPFKE
jgi:tRNA threonylcarbamoyl adenosine modification protein (Sua5/YciO/YrdC/YwlC family)